MLDALCRHISRLRTCLAQASTVWLIGFYCITSSVTILCLLLVLVPSTLSSEVSVKMILPLAALAGALGASIHMLTSFSVFAGRKELTDDWRWWYYLRPIIGASLGALFVLALNGAIAGGEPRLISPATHLAVAGLAGLFSKQAIEWLKELFDRILKGFTKAENPPNRPDVLENERRPEDTPRPRLPGRLVGLWLGAFVVVFVLVILVVPSVTGGEGSILFGGADISEATRETQFLLAMALCAMLGSLASMPAARGLRAIRAGTADIESQLWPAVLRPFVASSLAVLVYFLSRGFLFDALPSGGRAYALTSAAVLIGLFTEQGLSWLSGIADTVFQKVTFDGEAED